MLRVALRNIVARFGRIALTALAIVASTAFLCGTFVFRDTIGESFDAAFAAEYRDVDVYVQSSLTRETALGFEVRDKLRVEALAVVQAVPGVVDAQAFVKDDAVVIGKDGEPIQTTTRTTYGATFTTGPMSVWQVVQGTAPQTDGDVVLDDRTAAKGKYVLGDQVKVDSEGGARTFTLVGIAKYNDVSAPGNATWALFDAQVAMDFVAKPGYVDAVLVRGDGSVDDATLAARVQTALGEGREALTGQQATLQAKSDLEKGLGFFTVFLSIFSFIALGVGCFVIYNVFSISAAQRRRENALLRAIGASRRQVTRMMLVEALAVGLLGSAAGLVGGIGLAAGIRALLEAFDVGIPADHLVLSPFTVGLTMVAGLAATLVAAIVPAIAAGRIPPVAAMAETTFEAPRPAGRRITSALVCIALGVGLIVAVVAGADGVLLAFAVISVFIGVLLFGPVMANPIATVLGAPVQRLRGVTGTMARGNVLRNPRRTARTAAPVLIGVALVTGASVFAASIKQQLRDLVSAQVIGQYVINSTNGGSLSFSQQIVDRLNALPEVGAASGLGFVTLQDATTGEAMRSTSVEPSTAADVLDYDFVEGSFAALTPDGILVSTGFAQRERLTLGSMLAVRAGDRVVQLRVEGIYRSSTLAQARVVHRELLNGTSLSNSAGFVVLNRAPGVSDADFRRAVDVVIRDYGIGELQDREQFIDGRSEIIDQSLSFVYGLLGLSVIIAILGIVLTMLLAVYERRRETGLLRAVGMGRSQVRTMVRWESVLTSLYGAVVGVALGLVLGYVVIVALRDQGLRTFTVPTTAIVVIVVAAFVVGVVAAVLPARRATRFDILQAIAADG